MMGAIPTFAAVFGPGIVLGIWLGWRQIPWMRGLATAIAITFVWGMVVWAVWQLVFLTAAQRYNSRFRVTAFVMNTVCSVSAS